MLEQIPHKETSLTSLQLELQKQFEKDLGASVGDFSKHAFSKIAEFIVYKQATQAQAALFNYFRGYRVPQETREALLFTIEAFVEKNGAKIDEIFSMEHPEDDKPVVLQSRKATPKKISSGKKGQIKKTNTPVTIAQNESDVYIPNEAFKKYLNEEASMTPKESAPEENKNQVHDTSVAQVSIEDTTVQKTPVSSKTKEVGETPITARAERKLAYDGWNDPVMQVKHKEAPQVQTTESALSTTQEVEAPTISEDPLAGIPNWKDTDISIQENSEFVSFIFTDKKNKNSRDSIMVPVDQKKRIEEIKKLIKGAQETKTHQEEAVNFSVGQTFKTRGGEMYKISKVTDTFVYLEGKTQKVESVESLSQLITEGTLIKVEREVTLSVGESFYDEHRTEFTIKEIKGTLVVLTDGKNEHLELKTNVQEYLKSGAFTRVEKTTESLDEQLKALGWTDADLKYFTEEMKKRVIDEQKRKPAEAKETGPVITHPEILDKKLETELGWGKEITEVLTPEEKFKYAITDNTRYTDVLVEKADEFRKRIKDRKLETIDNEITEIEKRRAERSLKIIEMKKILQAYYELNPKEKGDDFEKLMPVPRADTKNDIKGEPEKISQPIELSLENHQKISQEFTEKVNGLDDERTRKLIEYFTTLSVNYRNTRKVNDEFNTIEDWKNAGYTFEDWEGVEEALYHLADEFDDETTLPETERFIDDLEEHYNQELKTLREKYISRDAEKNSQVTTRELSESQKKLLETFENEFKVKIDDILKDESFFTDDGKILKSNLQRKWYIGYTRAAEISEAINILKENITLTESTQNKLDNTEEKPTLGEYVEFKEINKNNTPQDALKDIESTTQALEELRIKENHGVAFDILISQGVRYIPNFSSEIQLSKAYHSAKKGDTSWSLLNEGNTDNKALIKAVEEALTPNASL